MSLLNTFEALSTPTVQQAYLDLVGQILNLRQSETPNANVQFNWLKNAVVETSLILKADSIRTSGLDQVDSTIYWSNAWLVHTGGNVFDSGNVESFNIMPGNVGQNTFVTTSFSVLVPEKNFQDANTILNSFSTLTGKVFLSSFVDSILGNSKVYSNIGIRTGLDFALSNNYLNSYNYNSNSFEVQNSLVLTESAIELSFAKNKTDVTVHLLGGGGG